MTLQSSGAISLTQVQTEYGGSNPISFSEYIRNGTYVNVYEETQQFQWFLSTSPYYFWSRNVGNSVDSIYYANSNNVVATSSSDFTYNSTEVTIGNYTYLRGDYVNRWYYYGGTTIDRWKIKRKYSGSANNNIPTSASNIGMNDFYGGEGSLP